MANLQNGRAVQFVHVPLPMELHARLAAEAKRQGVSQRKLFEQLLTEAGTRWVEARERSRRNEPDRVA